MHLGVFEIFFEHVRRLNANFADLSGTQNVARVGIDDPEPITGRQSAYRADNVSGLGRLVIQRCQFGHFRGVVRNGKHFAHAVTLSKICKFRRLFHFHSRARIGQYYNEEDQIGKLVEEGVLVIGIQAGSGGKDYVDAAQVERARIRVAADPGDLRWEEADHMRLDSVDADQEIVIRGLGNGKQLSVSQCGQQSQCHAPRVDHQVDKQHSATFVQARPVFNFSNQEIRLNYGP